MLVGHILCFVLFFFLTVFWTHSPPSLPSLPNHKHTHAPPPPPPPPPLSHGALVSTDQAFNLSIKTYAYRDWARHGTRKRKNKTKKTTTKERTESTYYELLRANIFKVWLRFFCNFSYEILYESSKHLFLRAVKNMGELSDAAVGGGRGVAAMETKQIWTWVCSCSIIYCVDCFIFTSGPGQGIIFFSNSTSFEGFFFVYCSVQCLFFFLSFQYSHMSFAVPVLEMCLDVLYFHSCGIVGIMMVMIKLAHLCAVFFCFFFSSNVCPTWAVGYYGILKIRLNAEGCGLYSSNTLNVCAKKKKSPFNNTACDCAYNVKKQTNNQTALVNASKLCGPLMMYDV